MNVITIENLTKVYETGKKAVDNISINLKKGEVFGFLGPNGAGKTTTVKVLNGILRPTEGMCRIFDIDPGHDPIKAHGISGVVTEHAQMYGHLNGLENLMFYGNIFGMSNSDSEKRALYLLEKLDILYAKEQKLETYSTGMRQRLSLARAMMHRPQLLFLDEPTSGLDPESVLSVNQIIKDLAVEEGVTVFLCTHQLRYAQEICTSYGLINNGSMLAVGTLEELRDRVFSGITVNIKSDYRPQGIGTIETGAQSFDVNLSSEKDIPTIVKGIVDAGGNIYGVQPKEHSLEDIYLALVADLDKH